MTYSPEEQRVLDTAYAALAEADAARALADAVTIPHCVLCRQPGGDLVEGRDGIRWHDECARDV